MQVPIVQGLLNHTAGEMDPKQSQHFYHFQKKRKNGRKKNGSFPEP